MRHSLRIATFLFLTPFFGTTTTFAETVPEIPQHCQNELNNGRECLVSQIKCDNFLCITGEFHHELYIRLKRDVIGSKQDAIDRITRYEMWPTAVRRRDPSQAVLRVTQSLKGPFTYDEDNQLLEAIQYADFQANSPIGWQPMTMVNRFGIVDNGNDPSYGTTFLTTSVRVDTGFDVRKIAPNLPWSRGIKFMDGYLHLVEEHDRPDSMIAVYHHNLRIGFDLAPRIAEASIAQVIRTITGALIDVMSTP